MRPRRPTPGAGVRRVLVAALALTLPLTVVGAADAHSDPVAAKVRLDQFPATPQVADIFEYLRGGSRESFAGDGLSVRGPDCVSYGPAFPASSVRYVSYLTASGDAPYFQGLEDPSFVVYEFASRKKAGRALTRLKRYARDCAGRQTADGSRRTLSGVDVPGPRSLGVGFRVVSRDPSAAGTMKRSDVTLFQRSGRRILESWIQQDGGARIDARHATDMADLLADTAG